jgi:hypothetical protein
MRKILKRVAISVVLLLMAAVIGGYFVHRSMQRGPVFYQEALRMDVQASSQASDRLEEQLTELRNEVLREDEWSVTLTEEKINGWLASGMPKRFGHVLPSTVSDPRISLDDSVSTIAFRYEDKRVSAIVTLKIEVFVTEEKNEIGLIIRGANAGVVPLPITQWTDRITKSAEKSGFPVRWTQEDGDPVALVGIEIHLPDQPDRVLFIKSVEIRDGELIVSGTADAPVDLNGSTHGLALRNTIRR